VIHALRQDNDFKLQPGLWRKEKLKVYPFSLTIFACPSCGMRSPVDKPENGLPFEVKCVDNKCGLQDYVVLEGYEAIAGLEKPGNEAQSVA